MMNSYNEFKSTLDAVAPQEDWSEALKCLWYDTKGDWEASHDIAQEMHNALGSWLHAYLHRKEGDEFNAGYWYRQAGRPIFMGSLEEEHKEIIQYVLTLR